LADYLDKIKEVEAAIIKIMDQYNTEVQESPAEACQQCQRFRKESTRCLLGDSGPNVATVEKGSRGKDKDCLHDLFVADPRTDKKRIEDTKGGLLKDSSPWILKDDDFVQFRNDRQNRLLWIKGDPGKGKTMLL
jgi:hypothetical protein